MVGIGVWSPAAREGVEHIPELRTVERTLETFTSVAWCRCIEEIDECWLLRETVAQECELVAALVEVGKVVGCASYHIRNVGNVALGHSLVECERSEHLIIVRTHRELTMHDLLIVLHDTVELLWCGSTHRFESVESCHVHHVKARSIELFLIALLVERDASNAATAHDDGFGDELLRDRRSHLILDAHGSRTLSEDGDVVGVAAKLADIVMNPFDRLGLVVESVVARNAILVFSRKQRMAEEAIETETVVDGDEDHIALCPGIAVKLNLVTPASHEGTTMDPYGNRQFLFRMSRRHLWSPDVEIETVFAHRGILGIELRAIDTIVRVVLCLNSGIAKIITFASALPVGNRLRLCPTKVAHRRSSVWYASIYNRII